MVFDGGIEKGLEFRGVKDLVVVDEDMNVDVGIHCGHIPPGGVRVAQETLVLIIVSGQGSLPEVSHDHDAANGDHDERDGSQPAKEQVV